MEIKVKKLVPEAVLPSYAHVDDAGMDLFCLEKVVLTPGQRAQMRTGIALEIPKGYVGLIWDKSGLAQKYGLKTLGGVVDSTYRGEIMVGVVNLDSKPYTFEAGHKIAQILIQKIEKVNIVDVDELSVTARGPHAFGSTGK